MKHVGAPVLAFNLSLWAQAEINLQHGRWRVPFNVAHAHCCCCCCCAHTSSFTKCAHRPAQTKFDPLIDRQSSAVHTATCLFFFVQLQQ